jgi:WD40-like Beta Propeller Repeat
MKRRWLVGVVAACLTASVAPAQLAPNANWRTIRTAHFLVHFTPPLESAARRAAAAAETAFAQLSRELTPPRVPIDLVLADNVDVTNGYATPFPTNRIVVYANPPVNDPALRFTDDANAMVVTHELTHIFQLDRSRGIWWLGQHVFGRAPYLFPNSYTPAWFSEGLAVYFESKLTGAGRVLGSEHRMIARALGSEHRFPSIDAISRADGFFPYGQSPYVFGSLFVNYLAETRGDHLRAFVESQASQLIPLWLDRPARQAFGVSFSQAWRSWSDSVTRTAGDPVLPAAGWRYLTAGGGIAAYPRWADDTAITYTGTTGRESLGAYSVTLDGTTQRVDRRNSESPTLVTPEGEQLFTQLEFTDPYHIRSDLFVQRGRHTVRLTRNARLTTPDRRADGRIVAVQTLAAATRLVTLASDGTDLQPLTVGSGDVQWAEPQWSPDGSRVAAVRWQRGGTSEIVVLDTTGRVMQHISPAHAVQAAPTWTPDGQHLYFTSDRSGVTNVYAARVGAAADDSLDLLTAAGTGIFYPVVSPDGRWLVGSVVLGDGYHLGVVPASRLAPAPAGSLSTAAEPRAPLPADSVTAPAVSYSPWRTLWPRYWMPVEEPSPAGGVRLGAFTSGSDVIGRHAYDAQVMVPTDASGVSGFFDYAYAGMGMPLLVVNGQQDWGNAGVIRDTLNNPVGELRKRTRTATVGATWLRPRFRTYTSFSLQAGLEVRDFATDPAPLLPLLDPAFGRNYYYPMVTASGSWSNAQVPVRAVSPEDGISGAFTARERFLSGYASRRTLSAVARATAYKSIDLPGFAHHALAITGSGGYRDAQSTDYFEVGGTSGSTLELAPGVLLGEGRRSFPVRGFDAATLVGIRAYAASAEYRMPMALTDAGWGLLPFFLDRSSFSVFYDMGSAWCPAVVSGGVVCTDATHTTRYTVASAGAELNVTAAVLQWDTPYRFRFGVAFPAQGRARFGVPSATTYFSLGLSF